MRKPAASALLGLALLAAVATASAAAERTLSSEVNVQPGKDPGTYLATVQIRDGASQEVLSAPKLLFVKGQSASTKTRLPDGEEVRFTVEVAASGSSASYTAEILRDGKAVSVQKASLALSK